jgi:hypothetical protein
MDVDCWRPLADYTKKAKQGIQGIQAESAVQAPINETGIFSSGPGRRGSPGTGGHRRSPEKFAGEG